MTKQALYRTARIVNGAGYFERDQIVAVQWMGEELPTHFRCEFGYTRVVLPATFLADFVL